MIRETDQGVVLRIPSARRYTNNKGDTGHDMGFSAIYQDLSITTSRPYSSVSGERSSSLSSGRWGDDGEREGEMRQAAEPPSPLSVNPPRWSSVGTGDVIIRSATCFVVEIIFVPRKTLPSRKSSLALVRLMEVTHVCGCTPPAVPVPR